MDWDNLESDAGALEELSWRVREAVELKLQDVEWERESVDRIRDLGNLLCLVSGDMAHCKSVIDAHCKSVTEGPLSSDNEHGSSITRD